MSASTQTSQPGRQRPTECSPLTVSVNAALDAREVGRALQLCTAHLALMPDDPEAHRHLGVLHAASGARVAALDAARRACELAPDDPQCWCSLGNVYAMLDQLADAALCFAEVVKIDVRHAEGWHNLGTALKQLGQFQAAITSLKNALLIDGTRADSYLNLGTLFVAGGRFEDALECFERAFKHDPQMPGVRTRLAWQMSERGKVKRAEDLFRQSLSMNPEAIEGWLGLGHVLEDLGEAEGARSAYLSVLRRRPDHAVALGQYLALVRDEASRQDGGVTDDSAFWLARAEQSLRDDQVRDEAKALIGYGVAKYHDRRRQYRAAAAAGLIANAARRRIAGAMDREALRARVDCLIDTYTSAFFSERRRFGAGTDQPVFIVGLPRSGTTLTEQVLAAHPLMHGAGELPTLGRLAAIVAGNGPLWQAASLLDEPSSREIAGKYLRRLRDGAPKGVLRISDKTPLNYFQLAFACVLFPAARIVHCQRSAPDNALSIWMENFAADQRYATDFDDLAFFRAEYVRLMTHWREVLPLQMIDLQYEETVADLNSQARRLIDFLGVPWDDGCLNFHSNHRAVQTPSRWQVRQPIYSNSVRRWQAYAEYLPGLSGGTTCSAATE